MSIYVSGVGVDLGVVIDVGVFGVLRITFVKNRPPTTQAFLYAVVMGQPIGIPFWYRLITEHPTRAGDASSD